MHSFLRSPLSISLAPFFALSPDALYFEHGNEEEDSDGGATGATGPTHEATSALGSRGPSVRVRPCPTDRPFDVVKK